MDSPEPAATLRAMEALLLILILFSDPSAEPAAKLLAEELALRGGTQVQVVIGAEAMKQLEIKGLRDGDLMASPRLAEHLTQQESKLVIVRLEHREAAGDQLVETRVWSAGRLERHTAIAGKSGDPSSTAVAGVVEILASRLALTSAPAATNGTDLPALVSRKAWREIQERLAAKADKNAREFYYLVLAQVRQRDATAKATVAAMAKAHPGHFMLKAAEALLPAETDPAAQETPLDQ